MKNRIATCLGELETKLNGTVALLYFRYMNLCVKAEVVSLLSVVVKIGGEEYKIEEVAKVAMPREDQFMIFPEHQEFLFDIGKAIAVAHPEFDQDIVNLERDSNADSDDPNDDKGILLTMPVVNDDRHDVLTDSVKTLFDEAKTRMDFHIGIYTTKVTAQLAGSSAEELKEAKDGIQELTDRYGDLAKQLREEKEKEIENAYQLYLKQQEEKDRKTEEEQAATNEEAKTGFDISQFAGE